MPSQIYAIKLAPDPFVVDEVEGYRKFGGYLFGMICVVRMRTNTQNRIRQIKKQILLSRRIRQGEIVMCGIVGFSGRTQAVPVLLEVLTHLEYRGYDSSGVAFFEDGIIKMIKAE